MGEELWSFNSKPDWVSRVLLTHLLFSSPRVPMSEACRPWDHVFPQALPEPILEIPSTPTLKYLAEKSLVTSHQGLNMCASIQIYDLAGVALPLTGGCVTPSVAYEANGNQLSCDGCRKFPRQALVELWLMGCSEDKKN